MRGAGIYRERTRLALSIDNQFSFFYVGAHELIPTVLDLPTWQGKSNLLPANDRVAPYVAVVDVGHRRREREEIVLARIAATKLVGAGDENLIAWENPNNGAACETHDLPKDAANRQHECGESDNLRLTIDLKSKKSPC